MAVTLTISIDQNSQNVANNTSNVTVGVRASWTGGSYNHLQKSGWVKIDGTTYNFTNSFNNNNTTSGTKLLYSKTLDIKHANDGKKTLACSASYTTGVSSGIIEASASKTLTTIPRKSSLAASNGTLGTEQTLKVTRQATSFTHTITYKCGTASGTVCTKSTSESIKWTPPLSLSSQNTVGTSVTIDFTITTYSGDTSVGSNTKSIACAIPSTVKPSCSITVSDPTGNYTKYGSYIQGLSKFDVDVDATTSYGSAISTYKTTANGSTYTKAEFTTGIISSSGTLKINATVTDKRGRSGTASKSLTVTAYSLPSISQMTVGRCDKDGNADDRGEFVKVTFSTKITSLSSKNTANYILKYKKTSDAIYTEVALTDYAGVYSISEGTYVFPADSSYTYNVELDAVDAHNTIARTTTVSTGFTLMHWNVSGDGMGIGKVSELPNVLDIGMQTRPYGGFLHPVLEPNTDLNDIRTPNTYVGANISNDNKYTNCPLKKGTFTLEVLGMGENGQVLQRVTSCDKTAAIAWERIYYTSAWGEWVCVSDYSGHLLANPNWYMSEGHIVELTEPVSKQKNGIVLVFSRYDGGAVNESFSCHFVPKHIVSLHNGKGFNFNLNGMFQNGMKYLYISDTQIKGHENNNLASRTVGGITYVNNYYVLRYVIGV